MKLSISNIAWEKELDSMVYPLIQKYDFTGIEVAPGKYFQDIKNPTNNEIAHLNTLTKKHGLKISAFQAILFGKNHLKVFESAENRKECLEYLKKVIDLASILKVPAIIFGSPKNRLIPKSMPLEESSKIAKQFFYDLGMYAQEKSTSFCIEPNPPEYGGNFINSTQEGATFVRKVGSPGFGLHIDTGTIILNDEDFQESVINNLDIIHHFHISNPFLLPLSSENTNWGKQEFFASLLRENGYDKYSSIEMITNNEKDVIESIKQSIEKVRDTYLER